MAKKLWERVQEDIEKNRQASEQIRINANNQFNENIRQNGEFDTNRHTTSISNLMQSQKDISNERYNSFKKSNRLTLWDTVKRTANDLGRVTENMWLGATSGAKQSFNYTYKAGRNNLRPEEMQSTENVLNSSSLSNEEKDFFLNLQKNNNNKKANQSEEKALQIASQKSNLNEKESFVPIFQKNSVAPLIKQLETDKIDVEKINKVSKRSGFDESIEKDASKISENIESQSNGVTKKLAELAPSIGNMAVGGAVSAISPGAGASYFSLSSAGSYYGDAKQRGMSNSQAQNYAGIMGLMEGATEEITMGNLGKAGKMVKGLIKGTGKEVVKEGVEQVGKSTIRSALKEYGIGIAENTAQEALIEPIQEVVAGSIGGEDKANWDNMAQRMLQSGIDGGLVAVITGGAEIGIDSCVGIVEKSKKGETITQEELKVAVQDGSKKVDAERMIIDSVQQQINKYKDYNTNQTLDSVSQEWLKRAESIINGNNNPNLQQNTIENQVNLKGGQITNTENKTAQNGNMEQSIAEVNQNNVNKNDETIKQGIEQKQSSNIQGTIKNTEMSNRDKLLKRVNESHLSNETKNAFIKDLKQIEGIDIDTETYNQFNKVIQNEERLPENVSYETDESRKKLYSKYKNSNINYDSSSVDIALDSVKANRNGKRTVNQWLKVAEQLGTQVADKNNSEIEIIAFQSWNDLQPNTKDSITRYNNVTKKNEPFKKFTSDDWVNTIYKKVNEIRSSQNTQENDKLANNQQTVYNNTESEGGINGRINQGNDGTSRVFKESTKDQREYSWDEYNKWKPLNETPTRNTKLSRQRNDTSVQQNSQYSERKYNKQEYNQWEKSIRPKEENNLTIEERAIKDNIKSQYGKDIVFFDGENSNYNAGASIRNANTIYINSNQVNEFGLNKTVLHETMESNIAHNQTLKQDIVIPTIEKIIDDPNFKQQKERFWEGQTDKIPSDYAIAKDILCDRFAEIKSGESLDYKNVLSQETNMTIDYALESFHKQLYGKNIVDRNNQLNKIEANTQSLGYKPDIEGKQRKHYKSVMESDQVGEVGKKTAKSLLENDTYTPISNIDTISTANENISRNGVDNTYIAFKNKVNSNERITLQDVATGERLIQIFSQGGDFEKVNGLIQDVAILGTELGQQVQAMSLIKRMSPEGQLMYLNKVVERTNIKENTDLKVTDEMSKKILEAKNETELENVMTDIAVELGEQLPVNMGDKVRAWRYLSMLCNPKTHIKNLGANVAMNVTQQMKNKVAGAMEDVVGIFNKDIERTKTLRPANSDQRSFAKQDAEFMKDKIDGGGKYDIKNAIQSNKRQFDNKVLNAVANFNSDMLELEDNIFLKKAYQQAMQNYMSANKLSSSDMQNASVLQKAREYSSYQAQEATFHQFSSLAQRLTEIENKGGVAGKALEAVVPFKKTPINIAKSGIEYSPIGLAKSLTYDIVQLNKKTKDYKTKLEKGFISEAEYKTGTSKLVTKIIDNMAKGLTGTSLALLGYALKDMGILKSGNDGEDDEFKEKLGEQEYAIKIGDNTYTLDWISPSAIPMFMGATVNDLVHSEKEDNSNTLNSLMTSSAKALEPMTEMSMLQGLTSAISSYEQGSSNMLFDLSASAVSSYMGQFVPTALGQVAKTIDDKERDTSSTEKGLAKKVDQFKKQQMAKIPMVSKMLPARKDVWGNEKERDSNVLVRAYEVGLAPYNRKKVVEDYTEKELLKVFEDTGEKSVLPGIPNKDITINKQKYRLTSEEYNKAKENFGNTSKKMLDSLVKTSEYKNLTDEQKEEAINNVYSYAKEEIKVNYAKDKKQEIETTSLYNILSELKNSNNQSEYLSYSAKIQGVEKDTEKKQILANGKYSATTKETIYKNTLGEKDDLYNNILAKDNININEYLNYKLQKFESDKEDDGTVKGKSIKGSRPEKLYDYVNNMSITRNQKLAIIGTQCKLDRNEQKELYEYINKIPNQTQKEKLDIFSKYSSNFTIYKNNTISYK